MAERKIEGCAFPEKCKLNLPTPFNETLEKEEVVGEDISGSNKRQKLESPNENEKTVFSFPSEKKLEESKDGKEDYKYAENDDEDEHLKIEVEIVEKGNRITAADKGKGILIEESEEDDESDFAFIDGSGCAFSDELDIDSEDSPPF